MIVMNGKVAAETVITQREYNDALNRAEIKLFTRLVAKPASANSMARLCIIAVSHVFCA